MKNTLTRNDLDELSPLKFYVIRKNKDFGSRREEVLTGRIAVNLEAWRAIRQHQETVGQDVGPKVRTRSSKTRESLKKLHKQLVVELQEKMDRFQTLSNELGVQRKGQTSGTLSILESEIAQLQEVERTMDLKLRSWDMEQLLREQKDRRSQQQATLLYDGMTFDQWRDAWRRDLSVNVRIQAIQAFAAFANAGKGQEAVNEILEIAEQYDWTSISDNEFVQPLQETCVKVFTQQLHKEISVEGILRIGESENPRLLEFAPYVVPQLSSASKEANQALREMFPDMEVPEFHEEERRFGGGRSAGRRGGF